MFDILKGITEQVTEYSTWLGQIWYLCVFLFRAVVVVTIGGDVYSDEQSEFKCSTQEVGCDNICFNKFSKISHIRFWAFQLLAVATPTVLFHFFVIGATGRIKKMRLQEDEARNLDEEWEIAKFKDRLQNLKRKKTEKIHIKRVYDKSTEDVKEVAFTNSIHYAYFLNVIARVVLEGLFIYFSYQLFKFMDPSNKSEDINPLNFLWFRVPAAYKCEGEDISSACHQHTSFGDGGYVPCWISRPWEKTIFLRYMNILSALCFLLSAIELIYLTTRGTRTAKRKRDRKLKASKLVSLDSSFPLDVTLAGHSCSTLAVPIRLSSLKMRQDDSDADDGILEEICHKNI